MKIDFVKKLLVIVVFCVGYESSTQPKINVYDYANFEKYREANMKLDPPAVGEERVVFMGNSITESWPVRSPRFFEENGFIGRGISGQVTHQMLLRFREDVIGLKPKLVVILAGINDIAQNSGYVPIEQTAQNIMSMCEIADQNGIKVIISSVLPAIDFPWNPGLQPAGKVVELNTILKNYANDKGFVYLDYYSEMVDENGGLKVPDFTSADDLVHPNENGYKVMESLLLPAVQRALAD